MGLKYQFWQLFYFTSKFTMSISENYWIWSAHLPKTPQDSIENWTIFYKFGWKFQEGVFIREGRLLQKIRYIFHIITIVVIVRTGKIVNKMKTELQYRFLSLQFIISAHHEIIYLKSKTSLGLMILPKIREVAFMGSILGYTCLSANTE